MSLRCTHVFLVSGEDRPTCERRVRGFLDATPLVRYDRIDIAEEKTYPATSKRFAALLDEALSENRARLADLMEELRDCGCTRLEDLPTLSQGYPSKLLHLITHLVDGFFGVDATFYDIDELSCTISRQRQEAIRTSPSTCWLVTVHARSGEDDDLARLRNPGTDSGT